MFFDRNINGYRDVKFLECDYLLVQQCMKLTLEIEWFICTLHWGQNFFSVLQLLEGLLCIQSLQTVGLDEKKIPCSFLRKSLWGFQKLSRVFSSPITMVGISNCCQTWILSVKSRLLAHFFTVAFFLHFTAL